MVRYADMTPEQKEAAKERQRRYDATPKGKAKYARYRQTQGYRDAQERYAASGGMDRLVAYNRRHRAEHPDIYAARKAVQAAVRTGRLVKPDSCPCGARRVEAHHHRGYREEHQLDVVWLCSACHKRAHGKGVV